MRRCAAFVGVVSLATAAGLLSARAADNPTKQLQRFSQLRAQVTQPAAAATHSPGDAVVTGFSGVRSPQQVAPGVNPLDKTVIDLDGHSVRVIDLSNPGAPAQGQAMPASRLLAVTARQIGQVFAVALDDATPPNIYVAATSTYGLPIVAAQPDRDGTLRRLRRGEPGARFMAGLFGPESAAAGPGSIWKIDGRTGAASLFATIPNSGASLGDIAFDAARRQFFISDRASGLIHRIGLDGVLRDSYDHGTTGRRIVGLAPVPDQPERRLNIQTPAFDPGNPQTWNFPPPARRTFGLAIFKNRLFYALAEGPQVWSLALASDGGFGTSASWELSLPPSPRPAEVASILFDNEGQIYLAERGASTGAYDFKTLAAPGEARVLRYRLREPNDSPGTGRWAPVPDEYSVGYRPDYRNTNGGIAFGYRYTQNNTFGACGGTLWSTGEQLRAASDPALAQQLAASGLLALNGVQGVAVDLFRPRNTPPRASLFVRYDDRIAEAAAREQFGHMGDVAIWQSCGAPPPRLVLTCPIGFHWNGFTQVCELPVAAVTCPPGQRWDGGACAGIVCWGGQRFDGRQCVCPPNMVWNDQRCTPARVCPTGQVLDGERCVPGRLCPVGEVLVRDGCAPPPRCPPGQAWDSQAQGCACPAGQGSNGAACQCPPGQYFNGSSCVDSNGVDDPTSPPGDRPRDCPPGQIRSGDLCIVTDPKPPGDQPRQCPPGQIQQGNLCLVVDPGPDLPEPKECGAAQSVSDGCVCKNGRVLNGRCLPTLTPGEFPPPGAGLNPPAPFCQGGPFKLVGNTCCLGNDMTCTMKLGGAVCPSGTDYELGPPWSSYNVCCRSDSAGTCAPPSQSSGPTCAPVTESRTDRCGRWYSPTDPRYAACLTDARPPEPVPNPIPKEDKCFNNTDCAPGLCCRPDGSCGQGPPRCEPVGESKLERCSRLYPNPAGFAICMAGQVPGMCFANSDCNGCCGRDGFCHAQSQATSVPPPPQTCPEGQTQQGGRCAPACTNGRVWNGEFCVCPNNGHWNGSSCEPAGGQPLAQPSCRDGTRWDGKSKKCVPVRSRPKCKSGTRWDGERCTPIAQPNSTQQTAPQSSPGFSIGIGIGGGGRGGRGPRPPQGPPPSKGGGGIPN